MSKQKPKSKKKAGPSPTKTTAKKRLSKKVEVITPIQEWITSKMAFFITCSLLIICGTIIFYKYLSNEYKYIFEDIGSDTITLYYPALTATSQLKGFEAPKTYNFHKGMGGGNTIGERVLPGTFFFTKWLLRPFSIPDKIPWNRLLRIIFGGVVFFFFMKFQGMKPWVSMLGSILFAFCGYFIVGSSWYNHGNYIFNMMLIILATEMVISKKLWWLFPIAVSYFIGPRLYFLTEFLVLYTILRTLDLYDFNWKKLFKIGPTLVVLGILGVLIAGPKIGTTISKFKYSPRVSGKVSYVDRLQDRPMFRLSNAEHNGTAIFRAFNNDLLGPGTNYGGWRNYLEAPLLYIGLLVLLLIPQLFFFVDRKRKILYGLFAGVWIAIMAFPWFRYAFYNFVGDYYKSALSLFIPLSFLVLAMYALNHIVKGKKPNLIVLGVTTICCLALLYMPNEAIASFVDQGLRIQVTAFLIIQAALLAGIALLPKLKTWIFLGLVFTSITEITYFSHYSNTMRDSISTKEWNSRTRHNDYTVEAVEYIKQNEKDLFYRTDKTYGSVKSGYNDGMVQGYMGTKSYASHNNKFTVRFLNEMGIIDGTKEYNTRWLVGLSRSVPLHPLVSTKYLLSTSDTYSLVDYDYYEFKQKFENVEVNENKYYIPLGMQFNQYISFSDFQKLSSKQKERILYYAVVLEDARIGEFQGLKKYDVSKLPAVKEKVFNRIKRHQKNAMVMTDFQHKRIEGKINMKNSGVTFFSIPYHENWKAWVDGTPVVAHLMDIGFLGIQVPQGEHEIKLEYRPTYNKIGTWVARGAILLYLILLFLTKGKVPKIKFLDEWISKSETKLGS